MFFWSLVTLNFILLVNSLDTYGDNSNSCVDSCSNGFVPKYSINLNNGNFDSKDSDLVEILEGPKESSELSHLECSKNVLLRIPFLKLVQGTIVKIEMEYGDLAKGTTFHIGNSPTNDLFGADRNTTMYNSEIYANETNLSYYMSSLNLCDQDVVQDGSVDISRLLFLNESLSFLNPKSKIVLYISEKWFRVDNLEKNTSFYYNNNYLFTFHKSKLSEKCEKSLYNTWPYNKISPFLYIGLNRVIADSKLSPGSGLCNAEISFLNCHMNSEPDMEVNVAEMKYNQVDKQNIAWVNPLSYLEPSTMEHAPCSGQGVLKLKFDPKSDRKAAKFDLDFGEVLSGFTFNIGDSATNNAYGGDSGTTSNSAEIHSNDNRFYVWLNTKYCGDTLLYKIEYNLFQSNDKISLFISDQRIEITNNKGYHEILKNPYLYNLNGQNVTCNCFDTRCYAGVEPDDDIYFGINRVIAGTYRPGVGLCNVKISWLQCKNDVKANFTFKEQDYVDWYDYLPKVSHLESSTSSTTTTKITTTTTTTIEQTTSTTKTESLVEVMNTTKVDILEILKNSSIEILREKEDFREPLEVDLNSEEESKAVGVGRMLKPKLGRFDKGKPLLIQQNVTFLGSSLNENLKAIPLERFEDKIEDSVAVPLSESFENLCTEENVKNNLVYYEYKSDSNKFILCEGVNKQTILSCPLNMKWSQSYQQCLDEI